jgi:hypothetical protein
VIHLTGGFGAPIQQIYPIRLCLNEQMYITIDFCLKAFYDSYALLFTDLSIVQLARQNNLTNAQLLAKSAAILFSSPPWGGIPLRHQPGSLNNSNGSSGQADLVYKLVL